MEPARSSKSAVDQLVWNTVVQRVKEADILAGARDLGGDPLQRTLLAGEIGTVIDDRDHPGDRFGIRHRMFLEQMHPVFSAPRCARLYRAPGAAGQPHRW